MFGIETTLHIIGGMSIKKIVRLKLLPSKGDSFSIDGIEYSVSSVTHSYEGGRHTALVVLV